MPGTYRMIVKYSGKSIAECPFTFKGAKIKIGKIGRPKWKGDDRRGNVLENMSVEIVNEGDLPAYVYEISGEIDEEEIGKYVESWIEPGGKKIVSLSKEDCAAELESGWYSLTIRVIGAWCSFGREGSRHLGSIKDSECDLSLKLEGRTESPR
ncbi:MAG: hypothetical protein QXM46_03095 [Candidatus Hadarchaeales archaeon]